MIKLHNSDKQTDNRGKWTVNNDDLLLAVLHSQVIHEKLIKIDIVGSRLCFMIDW